HPRPPRRPPAGADLRPGRHRRAVGPRVRAAVQAGWAVRDPVDAHHGGGGAPLRPRRHHRRRPGAGAGTPRGSQGPHGPRARGDLRAVRGGHGPVIGRPGPFEAVGPFVRAVYAKEMLESLRDRRTLLVMILLPALVVPLATLGIPYLEQRQQRVLRSATPAVAIVGQDDGLLRLARTTRLI